MTANRTSSHFYCKTLGASDRSNDFRQSRGQAGSVHQGKLGSVGQAIQDKEQAG